MFRFSTRGLVVAGGIVVQIDANHKYPLVVGMEYAGTLEQGARVPHP